MSTRLQETVKIKKIDLERQIVFGEVYAPYVLDTYAEMMLPDDIELMAHRFMQMNHVRASIDTMHDETSNGSYPIESFIARDGDPDYTPGSWVLGVKIVDDKVWQAIKRGDLNGYSFQAMVKRLPAVIEIDIVRDNVGYTEASEGHDHIYYVELDDAGKVKRGMTTTDAGHDHTIRAGTATEQTMGHAHRFFVE